MKKIFGSLYIQVLIAILAGILLGILFPSFAVRLKPLGDAFIKLVKMMIAPVIFCSIVLGIAGMQDMKKAGRVGLKAIIYFEVMSTIALIIGLVIVNIIQPGKGLNIDPSTLDPSQVDTYVKTNTTSGGIVGFLLHIIPDNIVDALAKGDLLQVLFFAVLFGFGLASIGNRATPIIKGIQSLSDGLFSVLRIIMKVAPIGAFGAMAFTIGQYGISSLARLGELMLCFYLTCIIFIFIVLGAVLRAFGHNILKLLNYIKDELFIVLGTSSSEAGLPGLMNKLEGMGCSTSVVRLVVPTGYSFNLDGTSIYLTMAAVFLAQATNTPMNIFQQLTLLLVLLLTSKGAAAVTGGGFITLAATLPAVGHIPVAAIALILGIDRFMSEARALTNIIGNAVATIVVDRWEGGGDKSKVKS
ncbi:MAG: dicarboxylate/amino acid:cation symporter [Flavisolibacter sp.]